ncbi:MAG: hypothetical protein ACK4ZE_01270 [Sphingorhabdus sp.]
MKHFWAPITVIALGLSGCAQDVQTRVSSAGMPDAAAGAYMISTTETMSAELRQAYPLVTKTLASKGYSIANEAPLHLQVTVDSRDAALSVGGAVGPTDLAAAKKQKPLQSCKDKEYRFGVTLTRVADGAEIYRGRAAEYHCKMALVEALPTLVDAALADVGAPRGAYTLSRKGVD